jgi:hypothetical protein
MNPKAKYNPIVLPEKETCLGEILTMKYVVNKTNENLSELAILLDSRDVINSIKIIAKKKSKELDNLNLNEKNNNAINKNIIKLNGRDDRKGIIKKRK